MEICSVPKTPNSFSCYVWRPNQKWEKVKLYSLNQCEFERHKDDSCPYWKGTRHWRRRNVIPQQAERELRRCIWRVFSDKTGWIPGNGRSKMHCKLGIKQRCLVFSFRISYRDMYIFIFYHKQGLFFFFKKKKKQKIHYVANLHTLSGRQHPILQPQDRSGSKDKSFSRYGFLGWMLLLRHPLVKS